MLIIWLLISDVITLRALSKSVSWLLKAVIFKFGMADLCGGLELQIDHIREIDLATRQRIIRYWLG